MKISLTVDYKVEDTDPEVEALLEEVIADEARGFAESIRRRLAAEGVGDIEMTVSEKHS